MKSALVALIVVVALLIAPSSATSDVIKRVRRAPSPPPQAQAARDFQLGYQVEEAAPLQTPEEVAREFKLVDLAQGNAEQAQSLLDEESSTTVEEPQEAAQLQETLTNTVVPSALKPVKRALSNLKATAEQARFREEQPAPSLQILAQTTNVQQLPATPGSLALAGSRPGIPSNVAVSTAQALQPAASPRTDIGNPAAGTFAVQAVPGVRILNPDGSEPCGCPESGGPCDNPCAPTRTVGDEIEDRLDLVKTKIVQDAQKVQQNTQWIKEVQKIIQHYNAKIKDVNVDTGRVRDEIRKLFSEKKRFEDLLLQQKLDVTTFDKIVQKQKDLGLTCASPPSTC